MTRRARTILLAALMAVPFTGAEATFTARAAGAAVTSYSGTGISFPEGIAVGSDGALWFANRGNSSIGRIATDGTVTNYTDPSISDPLRIAAGPDGALWFTNSFNNSIGRITTGGIVTNYTDPSIEAPWGITAGPDGALWFTNRGGSIGRISTSGTVTHYTDPSIADPLGIAAGPDGALWFTDDANQSIGRISTSGTLTHYTDPSISAPFGITAGPDGAMWFTNNGSLGRIATDGTVTHYTDPNDAYELAAGPDGNLWFTDHAGNSVGRITMSGSVLHLYDSAVVRPNGITAGPDGALWFTMDAANSIGRITPPTVPGLPSPVFAVPYPNATANVIWRAPATDGGAPITGYRVTPYLGSVALPVRVFHSTSTHELVTALQNGKTYQFTVAAVNGVGAGASSSKSPAMIVGAPGQPGQPTVVKVGLGSLRASFAAPNNDGAAITSYAATCTSTNGGATKTGTGSASPVTITGVTPGRTYKCRVTATNSRGTGPRSAASFAVKA